MKTNFERTTVQDISRLINTVCLRAKASASLEELSSMLCASDRYKVYLESDNGSLCGVVQAKQIAMEILRLSTNEDDAQELLPAQTYMLNVRQGMELAENPMSVTSTTTLRIVLEIMEQNHIREIAVVDEDRQLIGTLEAKHILSHYLREKAIATL